MRILLGIISQKSPANSGLVYFLSIFYIHPFIFCRTYPTQTYGKPGVCLRGQTGYILKGHNFMHTMDNLEMPFSLLHMSMDWGGNQSTRSKPLKHGEVHSLEVRIIHNPWIANHLATMTPCFISFISYFYIFLFCSYVSKFCMFNVNFVTAQSQNAVCVSWCV